MAWDSGAPNTSLLTTYLEKKFVPALEDELQMQKFTTKGTIPQGMGNVLRWNVFNSPAVNVTALTEGTTTGNQITTLTTTATEATILEYGEFMVTTRLMEYCQVSGARSELADRFSYGAARSVDALVRNAAVTTTTARYTIAGAAGAGTSPDTPTAGSAAAIIHCGAVLRGNSARGFAGVAGHPQRHLAAVVSTTFERDMVQEATTGRMTWAEANTDVPGQAGQGKWVNGFMGSVYGTACYRSQNLTQTTITSLSDNNLVFAEGGVGSASIIDANPRILINTASSGDVGNPYRNRNTIAWHIYMRTALIDSNRIVRLYSLA